MSNRKIAVISKECVACGTCVNVCPRQALSIYKGKYAVVDSGKCVGCGKCASECPGCVISIMQREGERE